MIACFPDPYPDELLFSVCARLDSMMLYPQQRTAVREMFGDKKAAAAIALPNRIDCLINALLFPHLYTADGLIDDNTLFPFYAPFVPTERASAVRLEMRGTGQNHVYERLGITAGRLKQPTSLKFCPVCVLNDRKLSGETYWHRVHQVPGVEVCPHHSVFLEISVAPWQNSKNNGEIVSAERAVHTATIRPLDLSEPTHHALLKLAQSAAWLLKWRGQAPAGEDLRRRYYNIMLRRGLAYYNGRIRSGELLGKFIKFYTTDLLEKLQCPIGDQNESWLLRLVHLNKVGIAQHPLRHLLLMTFLECTPEEVFTSFSEYKPFGDKPWPCLNKASDHYQEQKVVRCRIEDGCKKNLGKPVGTFVCECGFTYTRTGPDSAEEDRLKVSSVQAYGGVWEASLRELWEDTSITIREIAQKLGVNELTVKRRAIQLGLTYPRNTPGAQTASGVILDRYRIARKPLNEELEGRRAQFMAVRETNHQAGRLQLQRIAPSLLNWLRRYDSEWLEERLPAIEKSLPPPVRVDWEGWDVKLAGAVVATALQIKQASGYPVRVSLKAISDQVGHRAWFEKNLDRLPLTAEAIAKQVESFEDFLLRKVEWAKNLYQQQGGVPTRHQFEVRVGAKDRKGTTQKVQDAIKAGLMTLLGEISGE
jgi:hypothetical protein